VPEKSDSDLTAARAILDLLASTRTAVVLLALIAAASLVGTILPDESARAYVYGRGWFHLLLGLLGLNLVACMVWRRRVGWARIWSLLTHSGILLVLVGATVTLVSAERGALILAEGREASSYIPEDVDRRSADRRPLGFTVRLLDFRLDYYPPVDYVHVMRRGSRPRGMRLDGKSEIRLPGTGGRLTGLRLFPESADGVVEAALPGGTTRSVPARVGTTQLLGEGGLAVRVLRYEPDFKIDLATREVSSESTEPVNPALQVTLVRDGEEERPRWLFAKPELAGVMHTGHGHDRPREVELRFRHPSFPALLAEAETPSGRKRLRLEHGRAVPSPWSDGSVLVYTRVADRVREYESEVEVLRDEEVARRHVIRVNDPLVFEGTKLSQSGYDDKGLSWTRLGVSRDKGVWFVYAGFLFTTVGLVGKFYVSPVVRQMRTARPASFAKATEAGRPP
jgi:hypothetical protein